MSTAPFTYTPIPERRELLWPNDARVAFYIGLNVEHFAIDQPSTSIYPDTAALVPDPLNYGWRDYGARVGIWRLADTLDRYGIRPSVLLNSEVVQNYPQIVTAGRQRDWAWLAHGKTNSILHTAMEAVEERQFLRDVVDTIETATGRHPRGWLGPALTETFNTPQLLADVGIQYTLDWTNDDQPYEFDTPGLISVPYSVELNDIPMFLGRGFTGPQFAQAVRDQFDQLYLDSRDSGRVMALALHPFVIGQPFRTKYLSEALEYITGHPGVWVTTSDEIAEHYLQSRIRPV